jgi:hypothetical protein
LSVFFFLIEVATEMGITDDQYFDRRIMLVMLSVKIFLTNTNGINQSVKLFYGLMIIK